MDGATGSPWLDPIEQFIRPIDVANSHQLSTKSPKKRR